MCYPVSEVMHIKDSLLLIEKSNPCNGGSGFNLLLWSLTTWARCLITVMKCVQSVIKLNISLFLPLRFYIIVDNGSDVLKEGRKCFI